MLWDEAVKINGADPDFHRRDLWDAIDARATSPSGSWASSAFDDAFADAFDFDVLDPTKLIPEEVLPVAADRPARARPRWSTTSSPRPSRSAFCTQNIVPGIDFTNDPLLQGRNFSYLDTQLKRLGGPNFTHIPVNAPKCPMAHFQQDGHMAMTQPGRAGQLRAQLVHRRRARAPRGPRARVHHASRPRRRARSGGCGPSPSPTTTARPALFYRSQTADRAAAHRRRLHLRAVARSSEPDIRERMVANLRNVDDDLAQRRRRRPRAWPRCPDASKPAVAPDHDLEPSPALSILRQRPRLLRRPQGRRARHRRRAGHGRQGPRRPPSKAEGALLEVDRARPSAASPSTTAPRCPPTRWSAAARRCSTTPSPSSSPTDGAADAGRAARRPRTSSPTPTPTASSSATPPRPRRCSPPPASPTLIDDGYLDLGSRPTAKASSRPAGRCGTGTERTDVAQALPTACGERLASPGFVPIHEVAGRAPNQLPGGR